MSLVEPARSTWTDERLDHFRRAVDERFDKVDFELRQLGSRIDAQTARIDALHRTLFQVGAAQVVALFAVLATLVAGQH